MYESVVSVGFCQFLYCVLSKIKTLFNNKKGEFDSWKVLPDFSLMTANLPSPPFCPPVTIGRCYVIPFELHCKIYKHSCNYC